MGLQEVICKLCLEKCENFEAIDGNTKNILDILLLKTDFTVIQEPVMCKNCAEMLMKCFNFKATCLRSHGYTVPFVNEKDDIKLDLKDVSLNKAVSGASVRKDQVVCGFCMGLVKNCSTQSFDVEEGNVMLKKMVERCLPEIDLKILKKSVICTSCHESLENCFRFVTNCLIVDEKIKNYCETLDENSKGQIELSRLLQFIKGDIGGNTVHVIKAEEEFFEDRKNPDGMETCNGGDIIKLEQIFFTPSENGSEDIEKKKKIFLETDCQKVSSDHHVIPKNMLAGEEGSNKLGSIKREVFCEEEIKLEEETFVEMKDQAFLFNKEIEIKTDEHDFGRFEDGVVLSHPEATAELGKSSKCLMSNFEDLSKPHIKYTSTDKHVPKEGMNYYCDCCSFQTKNRCDLKKHLIVHKDPLEVTMHKCDSCSYQTKYKKNLKTHSLLHKDPTEVTIYKCDSCSYQTRYNRCLKTHLLKHKDPSEVIMHKCDSCSYQTKSKSCLKRHLLLHQDPSEVIMYKCDSCSYQTRHKNGIKTHFLKHKDPSEVTMHKCDSCSYQSRHKQHLRRHLLNHNGPSEVTTMYKCDFCSYETKYKINLKTHLLKHKEPSEVTMYKCDSCSYQSKYKMHLKRHLLKHKEPLNVTMYKCDHCSYQVKDKGNLKIHSLRHKEPSEVTMYKCDSCLYQSIYKDLLRAHLLTHEDPTKVTMHSCDFCSFQTKYKASLRKHLLKHKESSGALDQTKQVDVTDFIRKLLIECTTIINELHYIELYVMQGSNRGPLLFLLFVNDVIESLESKTYLYADDLNIVSVIEDEHDC